MSRFFDLAGDTAVLEGIFNGQNGSGEYKIGSILRSGGAWVEDGGNPMFTKTGAGFESTGVFQPTITWDGAQYVMYYVGYDGTHRRIARATAAARTGPWTRYGSNPVVGLGSSGAADETDCLQPYVLHEPADTGHEWKMWYTGVSAGGVFTICYAYSSDGLAWTKVGMVIGLGAGAAWDSVAVVSGATIKVGSTYYHLYSGRKNTVAPYHWAVGCATAANAAGPYTKVAGNPTLEADYTISGMNQALTADRNAGGATVQIASTAAWRVGMPMMLSATDVVSEYHRILSVDSGTQVTLADNAVASFTTAHAAVLRPFAYVSVGPVEIRQRAFDFELYINVFQPIDDLAITGEALWEGQMRAVGSSPDGAWGIDESSGLIMPLSPTNSGWDKYSAGDNLRVIVHP